ncbi:uncharacterized protein LOC128160727 [Crassostrea angulata]|uniref:uncharacterized protein LOC128160727 n=1 Tax=Magallana angulata TaxID=2784310 RepID=UPI0022B14705|nr:uncharacterized protein LOC128160727 [Crassostrea angulata]
MSGRSKRKKDKERKKKIRSENLAKNAGLSTQNYESQSTAAEQDKSSSFEAEKPDWLCNYLSQQQQFEKQRLTRKQQMKIWYQQNKEKKKQYERNRYQDDEKAKRKKQFMREQYCIPENADKKKQRIRKNYSIPENAEKKKQSMKEKYSIPENAQKKKQSMKENYSIPENAEKKKQSMKEKYSIPENAEKKKQRIRKNYSIPKIAEKKKQSMKEKYSIPENAEKKKQRIRKNYSIPENAEKMKQRTRENYKIREKAQKQREDEKQKYQIPETRKRKREQSLQNYHTKKAKSLTNGDGALQKFRTLCKEYPIYPCVVCGRIMFRSQVHKFVKKKYKKTQISTLLNSLSATTMEHICVLCDKTMKNGKIPAQALANNMDLSTVRAELSELNKLERHLVSPVIPFMKIVNLPKHTQKGIHGPVISVRSDITKVTTTLPRNISDESFIKVKLKRKLCFKGHHLYQEVRPNKIFKALDFLKKTNPHFEDIEIKDEIFKSGEYLDDSENYSAVDSSGADKERESEPGNNDHNESNINAECDDPDTEEEESTEESHDFAPPLDTSLQPSDLTQYYADQNPNSIFCIAPAEGNTPTKVIHSEGQAFPIHFPNGKKTYTDKRNTKISMKRYFNSRLFSSDHRFASDPEYIFFAQYTAELEEIFSSVSIAMRKSVDLSHLTSSTFLDSSKMKKMLKKDECYRFLQAVRGSPAYWEKTMRDLFAMLKQLGIPTFFITFSAAERRWTEIMEAICLQQGIEVPKDPDWQQYYNILNSNIVTATRMFDKRLHDFINQVIMSPSNPIGKVTDIFGRIEFQARGWPHYHGLVWIENAPEWQKSPDSEVTAFIDKYISCQIPNEEENKELFDIVSSVQLHSKAHTKTCKKGGKDCRFNFPRPCSLQTFIASPPKDEDIEPKQSNNLNKMSKNTAKDILKIFWDLLTAESDLCTADILSHGNITQEILQEALNVLSQRPTVVHRREAKDCWVNPYNPALLQAWNGNMDIQFILDPYSCIMYIMSYITKAEKELGELIKAAQREARQNNEEAIQELRKLGNVYLTHREISVMEAVYRVCGLKLKHCSRDVVWIPTDTENTRITLPMHVIKSNASRDDDNIWMTSILDRYLARPLINEFANMCLATFVSRYRVIANSTHTEEADLEEESKTETGKKIRLLHNMGTITRRTKKDAVIRYPKFSQSKDPEKYYFNLLRLYCPHRENRFLPSEYNSFQQYYETGKLGLTLVCNIVNENMKQFQKLTDQLDETWSLMKDMPPLEEAWAQVAPNSEEERMENEEEKELLSDEEFLSAVDIPEMKSTPQTNKNSYSQNVYTEPNPNTITDEKLLQMYRLLNKEQMELLNFIKEWCLQVLHSNSHDNFHIFLTGGAGAGKSLLIHCIYHMANKLFHKIRETPDDAIILKVAYTGKAALKINGQTIHSAFALKKNMKTQYQPLGENDLNTLRARLSNIQLLIIDEISMVSKTVLSYISGRLNQIKSLQQNSKPFGGISVLCVGDFYQIPPVFGKSLLCVDAGALPQDLWTLFKVHKLQKIMRQKEDLLFGEALNIIRTKDRDDPMNQDVENLLRSRLETSNCPSDAIHIFSTNEQVRHHNLSKLHQLGKPIISMTAVDILHSSSGKVFQRQTPFENLDTCLQSELKLAMGARVMLTVNIDTTDGLVNGTLGTVIDIVNGSMPYGFPEYIVLQFEDEHIGNNYRIRNTTQPCDDKCVPFRILSQKVQYKTGYITRFQFPFTLSWACTIHKVQGQTFKEVAVSLKRVFKGGMAYVALSRVTHLEGLHLLDYDPSVIYADSSVKQSLDQMEVLSLTDSVLQPNERENNFLLLHHNVQSLRKHFPDVKKMLEFYSPNVFCATETWLGEDSNQTCYDVDGFNLESVNSVQDRGAGAAVYIKIARVVDMWCGNNNTLHLVQWLQTVGFNVVPTLGCRKRGSDGDKKGSSKDSVFCCVNPEKWTSSDIIELEPIPKDTRIQEKPRWSRRLETRKLTSNTGTISTKLAQQFLGEEKNEDYPWTKYYRPDPELARKYLEENAAMSTQQRNAGDAPQEVALPSAPTLYPRVPMMDE